MKIFSESEWITPLEVSLLSAHGFACISAGFQRRLLSSYISHLLSGVSKTLVMLIRLRVPKRCSNVRMPRFGISSKRSFTTILFSLIELLRFTEWAFRLLSLFSLKEMLSNCILSFAKDSMPTLMETRWRSIFHFLLKHRWKHTP